MSGPASRRLEPLLRARRLRVDQALKLMQERRAQLATREQQLAGERARLRDLVEARRQQQAHALDSATAAQALAQRSARIALLAERAAAQQRVIQRVEQERNEAVQQLEQARQLYRRAQNRLDALTEQSRRWQAEEQRRRLREQESAAEDLVANRYRRA